MGKVLDRHMRRVTHGASKKGARKLLLPPVSLGPSEQANRVTGERFPAMTERGRAFLRRMDANPHVQRAMKDLANK